MTGSQRSLGELLDASVRREEEALLALARRVGSRIESFGAYAVKSDWHREIHEWVVAIANAWPSARSEAEAFLDAAIKNHFWGAVLDSMTANEPGVDRVFYPTIRRLLAGWDATRRYEAVWDDVAQDTARQLWEKWIQGEVERPWSLLCTIAKRRYLDRVRGDRSGEDLGALEEVLPDDAEPQDGGELFTQEALDALDETERLIVVRMDLEGETRKEIARDLELSEGQVLSLRRAGLRRLWRWMGEGLPPELRSVWDEMFKGARRASPEEVGAKLGIPPEIALDRVEEARGWLGL